MEIAYLRGRIEEPEVFKPKPVKRRLNTNKEYIRELAFAEIRKHNLKFDRR